MWMSADTLESTLREMEKRKAAVQEWTEVFEGVRDSVTLRSSCLQNPHNLSFQLLFDRKGRSALLDCTCVHKSY